MIRSLESEQENMTRAQDDVRRRKRTGGLHAIARQVHKVTGPLFKGRGLMGSELTQSWPAIVGAELAAQCWPLKLVHGPGGADGTLHVAVAGPLALELQHLAHLVTERINGHFGYHAVGRLSLHQRPTPELASRRSGAPARPEPDAERAAGLETRLEGVEDAELRAALGRLGRAILVAEEARRKRSDRGYRS